MRSSSRKVSATNWKADALTWLGLAATTFKTGSATPCAAYDGSGTNAYVFGTPYGDVSLGSDLANSANFISLTNKTGRPDFSGTNTQCFVNQFTNGLYVLGATANSSDTAYIYDFVGQSWSTQHISSDLDPASYTAILDHDTNVLYAYANGTMNALAFNQDKAAATAETIEWQMDAAVNEVPFEGNSSYQPVMGAANNHIHFLNTPGASAGEAYIFVIHYGYWQPEAQSYGSNLPNAHGQTVTILSNSSAAPSSFAFIPDGLGNNTFVINAKTNATEAYPAPPSTEATARYGASTSGLVQVAADGSVSYFNFESANQTWSTADLSAFNSTASGATTTMTSIAAASTAATASIISPSGVAPAGVAPSNSAGSTGAAHQAVKFSSALLLTSSIAAVAAFVSQS